MRVIIDPTHLNPLLMAWGTPGYSRRGIVFLRSTWLKLGVEGKFLMFPNRIWGSQVETQRWALEIKPKGYRCGVSPPKQEIEAAP